MMKKGFILLVAVLFFAYSLSAQEYVKGEIKGVVSHGSYMPSFESDGDDEAPLNVILMIGDGMGLAQLSSAMFANGGELTITNLKACGWVCTQSASDFTTDSAASGTAYSTGYKTHNGAIGVDVNDQPLVNLPEKLHEAGIISGLVTTDDMDGATPSAFFAHQPSRKMSAEIWADLADAKVIFFAGGSWEDYEKIDNSTAKAIQDRYYVTNILHGKKVAKAKCLGYLPPKAETASMSKGRGDFLPSTTEYAIEFLNSRANDGKGFFLMVEGARIDKSSHDNDFSSMVKEVLDFDRAVEAAIRFAEKDGNTLVIISADHETGALSLRGGEPSKGKVKGAFSSKGHTGIPVPLFAYGPGSQHFMGVQENSDVSNKIEALLTE